MKASFTTWPKISVENYCVCVWGGTPTACLRCGGTSAVGKEQENTVFTSNLFAPRNFGGVIFSGYLLTHSYTNSVLLSVAKLKLSLCILAVGEG